MAHVYDGHYRGCSRVLGECRCKIRRNLTVALVAALFCALEIGAGVIGHSVSLIADAFHLFGDTAGYLIVALIAFAQVKGWDTKVPTFVAKHTIGWLLVLSGLVVIGHAVDRIGNPELANGFIVMPVAFLGLVGNIVQHRILANTAHEHRDVLHDGNLRHILTDGLLSIAVIIGGGITWVTGNPLCDPMISLGVALVILFVAGEYLAKKPEDFEHQHHHTHHHA